MSSSTLAGKYRPYHLNQELFLLQVRLRDSKRYSTWVGRAYQWVLWAAFAAVVVQLGGSLPQSGYPVAKSSHYGILAE